MRSGSAVTGGRGSLSESAYLAAVGVGVLLAAVDVAVPWVTLFALLGAVHAAPLLADAAMLRAGLVARTAQVSA